MKIFSIKDLAARISQTQAHSRSTIVDRISNIQSRMTGIFDKMTKMQEFSKAVIEAKNPNLEGSVNKENPITGQMVNPVNKGNDKLNLNALSGVQKNSIVERLLQGGPSILKNSLSNNLKKGIIPEMVPNPLNMLLNANGLEGIYKKNQELDKKQAPGDKINLLDRDKDEIN